jgi:hypothetical protein
MKMKKTEEEKREAKYIQFGRPEKKKKIQNKKLCGPCK